MKKAWLLFLALLLVLGCSPKGLFIPADQDKLSDEDVKALYAEASTRYAYFHSSIMGNPENEELILTDEAGQPVTYYKVSEPDESYEEFAANVRAVFTEKLAEELISSGRFVEHEGALYGIAADVGSNQYRGEYTLGIRREGDHLIHLTAAVEELDDQGKVTGTIEIPYVIEREADGVWRFQNFTPVR